MTVTNQEWAPDLSQKDVFQRHGSEEMFYKRLAVLKVEENHDFNKE